MLRVLQCLLLLGCLSACGAAPVSEMVLSDHSASLTDKAEDLLFKLKRVEGEETYSFANISITARTTDGKNYQLSCEHIDANQDLLLNKGEEVICKEPPLNVFDASYVNKEVPISVSQKGADGILTEIAFLIWTPQS